MLLVSVLVAGVVLFILFAGVVSSVRFVELILSGEVAGVVVVAVAVVVVLVEVMLSDVAGAVVDGALEELAAAEVDGVVVLVLEEALALVVSEVELGYACSLPVDGTLMVFSVVSSLAILSG
jgi:hypothetical protein